MTSSAVERIWALVSGFPGKRGNKRQLLMLQAYVDGSGTGAKDTLVLAGYIATVEQWAAFSMDWEQLLRMGPYPKPYFKIVSASAKILIVPDEKSATPDKG